MEAIQDTGPPVDIAPGHWPSSLRGLGLVYGAAIASCYLVNAIVIANPIGPWTAEKVQDMYWLDNVTWQLLALWWVLLSVVSGGFPFHRIEDARTRAFVTLGTAWVVGWLSAKGIYWAGLDADWVFPIIGCIFFFIAFFSFAGENWLVAGMPPHRQFFILLVMIAFLTYAITHSAIRWIPAWWFPFIEMGSASGLLAYLTRRMSQPGKALAQIAILFLVVLVFLAICQHLGIWSAEAPGIGTFWTLGYFSDPFWLLWFMVACSVSYALLIQLRNWPFSRIPMPLGGILACLFCAAVTTIVAQILARMVGPVFTDMNEALTYAYMGTHWSFVIALLFGFGLERPYLWVGQKTPGSWEDVD
ncbi:hypothetical protein [Rhodobacteraceae bacterium DSL-40]|uniref:hypothetical protein n=1 Tax=Amaricoccus sp. B4 TaxID=3368557 RepID=UPI000DAE11AE